MTKLPEPQESLISPIRQYVTVIEWLNWTEDAVIGDYTADIMDDGSLSIDLANDVRRSFSMTANNSNGFYIPNGARTNMGVKVRIKRGVQTPLGSYLWNRGIYVLTDPSANHNSAEKLVKLNGVDKWSLHNGDLGGTLESTTVIPKDTNVADAIRAVAEDGGETKFAFDVCTVTTPYTVTREVGDTRADLMKELALIPSWELFYDVEGFLRFRPQLDPIQKQVKADLSVNGNYRKCYLTSEYNPEWSKIKNYWKVTGYSDPDTGIIYDGIAAIDNVDSQSNTATPPLGIGKKVGVLTDDNLTTDSLCVQRAVYELRNNLTKIDRSIHDIMPLSFLNEGDCVQLEDTENGIPDWKYEIQSITEQFGLGVMQIQCWQVVSVFEIVSFSDFQLGMGNWQQLKSGSIDIYAFSGDNCLRKYINEDPNGGYYLLDKECTDFEFIVYTHRNVSESNLNSYSVVNSDGDGYGIGLDYDNNTLILNKRTNWVSSVISVTGIYPDLSLSKWYTLRLVKIASNLTIEVYDGKTAKFLEPLAVTGGINMDYTFFDRVAVNGGHTFYSDNITVRKIL